MLAINNIEVVYDRVILVLKGVSIGVGEGAITTLLGANGAGKTTTLKAISGVLHSERGEVTKGTIQLGERRIDGMRAHDVARLGLVQVFEGRRVFENLTTEENLVAGGHVQKDGAAVKQGIELVYSYFPRLKERRHQVSGYLSGGEQQMLAIGRALMTNPKLLILDEATEGLAPLIRQEIWSCLDRLKREGQAILVIDKSVGALIGLADRHHIVEKGRIVWTGTSDALARDSELQHRYLGV